MNYDSWKLASPPEYDDDAPIPLDVEVPWICVQCGLRGMAYQSWELLEDDRTLVEQFDDGGAGLWLGERQNGTCEVVCEYCQGDNDHADE